MTEDRNDTGIYQRMYFEPSDVSVITPVAIRQIQALLRAFLSLFSNSWISASSAIGSPSEVFGPPGRTLIDISGVVGVSENVPLTRLGGEAGVDRSGFNRPQVWPKTTRSYSSDVIAPNPSVVDCHASSPQSESSPSSLLIDSWNDTIEIDTGAKPNIDANMHLFTQEDSPTIDLTGLLSAIAEVGA